MCKRPWFESRQLHFLILILLYYSTWNANRPTRHMGLSASVELVVRCPSSHWHCATLIRFFNNNNNNICFPSPLNGELTGSSWHLHYRLYMQYANKGSGDVIPWGSNIIIVVVVVVAAAAAAAVTISSTTSIFRISFPLTL